MMMLSKTIVVAFVALVSATGGAQAGKCVLAGGEATMATEDLAKFMAEAALKNSIAGKGMKAAGPIKMKCDAPYGLPHCLAQRKACS